MKSASLRTQKGVIEVEFDLDKDIISNLRITGDFFIYPEEALEQFENKLSGTILNKDALTERISSIYSTLSLSTPGITIADWVEVILKASIS